MASDHIGFVVDKRLLERIDNATSYLSARLGRYVPRSEFVRDVIDRYLEVMIPQWEQEDDVLTRKYPQIRSALRWDEPTDEETDDDEPTDEEMEKSCDPEPTD